MNKTHNLIVWMVLASLVLAACGSGGTRLSSAQGAAYAAEVDEYTESYLTGLSTCDFAMHTRGFDPDWKAKLTESSFQQGCAADRAAYGAYQSKTLDHVEDRSDIRVVIYHVKFEKNPDVPLSMYFYIEDPDHWITGVDFGEG